MPENHNPFMEFIEKLDEIDDIDQDIPAIDEAIVKWIAENYPRGFDFDYGRRNLMIKIVKKEARMRGLIMGSQLRPYLDAIIAMKWLQIIEKFKKLQSAGRKTKNRYNFLMEFAEEIFVLGYCLRSFEGQEEKEDSQ